MNQAMMKLAEKLGIDHDKMPREELADVVCEKALKCIGHAELELNTPWTKVSDQPPPSGTVVLLKQQHDGCDPFVIVGQYAEKHTIESSGDDDEVDYCEKNDTYYCPKGFYERQMNWDEYRWIALDSSMPVIEWAPIPGEQQ